MAGELQFTCQLRAAKNSMSVVQSKTTFVDDMAGNNMHQGVYETTTHVTDTGTAVPLGPVTVTGGFWVKIYNGAGFTLQVATDGGTNYRITIPPGTVMLASFTSSAVLFWRLAASAGGAIQPIELTVCER